MQAMMNLSNHPRCLPASTSQRLAGSPAARSAVRMTPQQPSVLVRADDGFCRDKVSAPKGPAKSEGKTYKVTFLGAGDQSRVIDCPDDKYILDAAEAQGLDLPATCRGGICGACVARVAKGKVGMLSDPMARGDAHMCMSACMDHQFGRVAAMLRE